MDGYKKFRKKVIAECDKHYEYVEKQKGSAKVVRETYLINCIKEILKAKP